MQDDLIEYALSSYSFVLPQNGEFSFKEWAAKIAEVYDSANVVNSAIISVLEKIDGNIIRRNGVNSFVLNQSLTF